MPTLLANAAPTFPFVDKARRQGLDLLDRNSAGTELVDLVGGLQTDADDTESEAKLTREMWGYWPSTLGRNSTLIKDCLFEFADRAAGSSLGNPETRFWCVILADAQQIIALANAGSADADGLTRSILDDLRIKKKGRALSPTKVQSDEITTIVNLRRILAVPSDTSEHSELVAAAYRLVEDDLVDNVVILAATDQADPATYFAGLRIIETLAQSKEIEQRLIDAIGRQRGEPVFRIVLSRELLSVATRSTRRLAIIQRMIKALNDTSRAPHVAGDADLEQEIKDIIKLILQHQVTDRSYQGLAINPDSKPGDAADGNRVSRTGDNFVESTEEHRAELVKKQRAAEALMQTRNTAVPEAGAALVAGAEAHRESLRLDLQRILTELGEGDERAMRTQAATDREVTATIAELEAGGMHTEEEADRVLLEAERSLNRILVQRAADQRQLRGSLAASKLTDVLSKFQLWDDSLDALGRPIVLEHSADRGFRKLTLDLGKPLLRYKWNAAELIVAERGLFRWIPSLLVGFAVVLAFMYPMSKTNVIWHNHWQSIVSFGGGALSVYFWGGVLAVGCGVIIAFTVARQSFVRAVKDFRKEKQWLDAEAQKTFRAAAEYRASHLACGRLSQLADRIRQLQDALERSTRVKRLHKELGDWPVPENLLTDGEVRQIEDRAEAELAKTPRAQWVMRISRVPDIGSSGAGCPYSFDGDAEKLIPSSPFITPLPIKIEGLEKPAVDPPGIVP